MDPTSAGAFTATQLMVGVQAGGMGLGVGLGLAMGYEPMGSGLPGLV